MATAGVILRPFGWPEYVWAVAGAVLLVALGLLPPTAAWTGVVKGTDVYLFLTGMMLLSELARQGGLFDWLAAHAARAARGSGARLFTLIYLVGTAVTVFLSNDATAVVLTPAVAAAVRAADAADPLPYLFTCAFTANAASFVLPISNPANLVLYGSHVPPLLRWLPAYALPSVLAIATTYAALRWTQRKRLHGTSLTVDVPPLGTPGKLAAAGVCGTAAMLLAASVFGLPLGLPTALAGLATAVAVSTRSKCNVRGLARAISWGVLPLVAGLFVLVQALEQTGVTRGGAQLLHGLAQHGATLAAWAAGITLAAEANLVNNLPAGLVAADVIGVADVPDRVRIAALIGVDLGPNLSVTGSLATILWLTALRREGQHVGAWAFLKVGALVMPPALVLAIAGSLMLG